MSQLKNIKSTDSSWKLSNSSVIVIGIFDDHTLTKIGQEINLHLNKKKPLANLKN